MEIEIIHKGALLTIELLVRTNRPVSTLVFAILPNKRITLSMPSVDEYVSLAEVERGYKMIMAVEKVEMVNVVISLPPSIEVFTYDRRGVSMGSSFVIRDGRLQRLGSISGVGFFNDLFAITDVTQEMIDFADTAKNAAWYSFYDE